jgi:hypothetical protein
MATVYRRSQEQQLSPWISTYVLICCCCCCCTLFWKWWMPLTFISYWIAVSAGGLRIRRMPISPSTEYCTWTIYSGHVVESRADWYGSDCEVTNRIPKWRIHRIIVDKNCYDISSASCNGYIVYEITVILQANLKQPCRSYEQPIYQCNIFRRGAVA